MDKRRREQYRKKLEEKQRELRVLIARSGGAGRETDVASPEDMGELASNSYTKEFLFRQSDSERSQLYLVQEALARTASRDFGRCQSCGDPIDKRRLDAIPWARNCRDCQEAEEHQGSQLTDANV